MDATSVRVLIAGCPPADKPRLESLVRSALAPWARDGSWSVSVVRLNDQWSVSIDGPAPPFKAIALLADEPDLPGAIRQALERAPRGGEAPGPSEPPAAAPSAAPGEKRDRHECAACGRPFLVVYEAGPDEPAVAAPVACPHCWHIGRVPVAESAAATSEYRAASLPS